MGDHFTGGKADGAQRWTPTPPSGAEVKSRVQLHLNSPSAPSWPVIEWTLPLPLPRISVRSHACYMPCLPHHNIGLGV